MAPGSLGGSCLGAAWGSSDQHCRRGFARGDHGSRCGFTRSGRLTSKPALHRPSTSDFIMRWATNWIICSSRSASAFFPINSANAIVGLFIVVSVGLVRSSQTQRQPRTTMSNFFRPQGAIGWFSYPTSRDTIKTSASSLTYCSSHAMRSQ